MIRFYIQQAIYHLRENPVVSWISVLGTALSICMIMVIVITLRVRTADCEPEVNRSRSLYVPNMSYRAKGDLSGSSANSSMSVQTGRECFKALTTAEAVTLASKPGKVRVSLPAEIREDIEKWLKPAVKLAEEMYRTGKQKSPPGPITPSRLVGSRSARGSMACTTVIH